MSKLCCTLRLLRLSSHAWWRHWSHVLRLHGERDTRHSTRRVHVCHGWIGKSAHACGFWFLVIHLLWNRAKQSCRHRREWQRKSHLICLATLNTQATDHQVRTVYTNTSHALCLPNVRLLQLSLLSGGIVRRSPSNRSERSLHTSFCQTLTLTTTYS